MCKHIAALQQYCIAPHQKQAETSVSLTYPAAWGFRRGSREKKYTIETNRITTA